MTEALADLVGIPSRSPGKGIIALVFAGFDEAAKLRPTSRRE
jgi:hypothetical protein